MVSAGEARVPRRYLCRRVESPLVIDGSVSGSGWSDLAWTEDFVDITGSPVLRPRFRTRGRMAWDDKFFYGGADMEEPHVWGTITEKSYSGSEERTEMDNLQNNIDSVSASTKNEVYFQW